MGTQPPEASNSNFEWDQNSQLYYHAGTGFYHDPGSGWYYSSRDGLYYKFEDGNYVLIESNQSGVQPEISDTNFGGETSESKKDGAEIFNEALEAPLTCDAIEQSEYPPPPSEWLEETLINMYLSGYSNTTVTADTDTVMPFEANDFEKLNTSADGDADLQELEEGEWIPDDPNFLSNFCENSLDGELDISQEEEKWQAQYGQVSEMDGWKSNFDAVDIWDWDLVKETKKDGKKEVTRLVGRLLKPSTKLHPSVPSGGGKLKTAPVSKVLLDMVRVTSGRIYRLRTPSSQYLASLSMFDASNPTQHWGFPQFSFACHSKKMPKSDLQSEFQNLETLEYPNDKFISSVNICSSNKGHIYRDRAAERRALHGGFGVGPGQKNSLTGSDSNASSPDSSHPKEAAAESLAISFGEGSYARKILESMGWKEGEALGSSMKGLTEPLHAIGNKGNSGLGWSNNSRGR